MTAQTNEAGAATPTSPALPVAPTAKNYVNSVYLDVPRDFITHGTPVFVAAPHPADSKNAGKSEFRLPSAWPTIQPDQRRLAPWRPGWAVSAVTGVQFDVIDVDPRNGGDISLEMLRVAGLLPPIYGEIRTPSGGTHLYIARTGFRKGSPAQGIDLQAGDKDGRGRGFVYITPTIRTSKLDGQQRVYEVVRAIDWDALREGVNHPDAEPWLQFLVSRLGHPAVSQQVAPAFTPRPYSNREKRYIETTMQRIVNEMAATPEGSRNDTLNRLAYQVGRLIAGCGVPEQWARDALCRAAVASGLSEYQAKYTIGRSIAQGKQRPIAPGPFAAEAQEQAARMAETADLNRRFDEYVDNYDEICEAAMRRRTEGGNA